MLHARSAIVCLLTLAGSAGALQPDSHAAPTSPQTGTSATQTSGQNAAPTEARRPAFRTRTNAQPTSPLANTGKGDDRAETRIDKPEGKSDTKPDGKPDGKRTESTEAIDADRALELLTEGNARWVANKPEAPNTSADRRESTAKDGQKPFVTVLSCADSRVPLERLFDRGVGDVFAVRVAGNTAGTSESGTIEYGIEHLHTPLLVVMAHSQCGAVKAAASGGAVHGAVADVIKQVRPAVERARKLHPSASGDELVNLAIRENVWQQIYSVLEQSEAVRSLATSGKLKVVGAVYDLESGRVEWLGEHPWQKELVDALNARSNARNQNASRTADADSAKAEH
ncbi:MAG: carbonic anhydrase [Planctomycetota bacterium]|nr:carbonic anhydrase [Planctomycetota bacterium]